MKVVRRKYNYSRRKGSARKVLAGLLVPAIFMLTSCGNSDMDPLAPPVEISNNIQERETATVERGNLTPTFKQDIELSGFNEVSYSLLQEKVTEMEMMYDVKFEGLNVSEGDRVSEGDTLLTFSSKILDEKSETWESSKSNDYIRKEHYLNLQALDGYSDYYDEIVELNENINLADQYISDVNETYNNINIVATSAGVVTQINESVKNGSLVVGAPIIKVVSDDGYYILDKSERPNMEKSVGALTAADMDFKVGDRFKAKYAMNEYEVEVIDDPTVSASSGNASSSDKVYFKLVNDESLKEKTLTISKELPEIKNTCYVDRRAIIIYNDETYVYKVMEDGLRKAVKVTVGEQVGTDIVIKDGLEEGDIVSIPDD